ncbi:MAG: histidine phosphatase family protein [Candidatus Dormibacteria bacterium]
MTATAQVILARHCDVENPHHVIYGHLDGFGLSALGREQAVHMGRYLRGRGIRRIVHSPLERAHETATLVAAELEGQVQLSPDPDLVEAGFSRYLQGTPMAQVPLRRPLWWIHVAFPGRLPNDEGPERMGERVERAVLRAQAASPGHPVLLVSHADPVQSFWVRCAGASPRKYQRPAFWVDKGGLLELCLEGGRVTSVVRVRQGDIEAAHRESPPPSG